jgi:hypothetical protein
MPISQTVINLLNLPLPQLRQLAKDTGVEPPTIPSRGLQKFDYVMALSLLPDAALRERVGDWLFAGRTSLTWYRLGEGESIEYESVRSALRSLYPVDPYDGDIRPEEVTHTPQLIDVRDFDPDETPKTKVVFTFAASRRITRVIHNFEVRDVLADEFFVAVLRLDRGTFEIRAGHERARQLASTWLIDFAGLL